MIVKGMETDLGRPGKKAGPPELVRRNCVTSYYTDADIAKLKEIAGRFAKPSAVVYQIVKDYLNAAEE